MWVKRFLSWVIIVVFIAAIGWYTVNNFSLVSDSVQKYTLNELTVRDLKTDVTEKFQSDDLYAKDTLINLNGLYGRVSLRRFYNQTLLLKNNSLLIKTGRIQNIPKKTQSIKNLDNLVSSNKGKFLFALYPMSVDINGVLLPEGKTVEILDDAKELLAQLAQSGIATLDLQPELASTPEQVSENFYRTDHHWKPTAAYSAFLSLTEWIQKQYPGQDIDSPAFDSQLWTVHEIPNQFLGYLGKRVGQYFAGLDDLQWMTPNFETELSVYQPKFRTFRKGSYENIFLDEQYMKPGGDKLHTDHYNIFIPTSNMIIRNPHAPSELKVLIIGDSFSRPLATFFSTVFQQVEFIDPRNYEKTSILEYVDRSCSDIVIYGVSVSTLADGKYFSFSDSSDLLKTDEKKFVRNNTSFTNDAKDSNYNHYPFYKSFSDNLLFTLRIPKIIDNVGNADAFTVTLYDTVNKKMIDEFIFDIDLCNRSGNCQWTFETPSEGSQNLRLLVYSGLSGQTKGNSLSFSDVSLVQYDVKK